MYEIAEEMSRIEARKRDQEEVVKKNERLESVMEYLRVGSEAEAGEVLRRLRTTEDMSDAVQFINDSSALLNMRFSDQSSEEPISPQATVSSEKAERPEPRSRESAQSITSLYEPFIRGTTCPINLVCYLNTLFELKPRKYLASVASQSC